MPNQEVKTQAPNQNSNHLRPQLHSKFRTTHFIVVSLFTLIFLIFTSALSHRFEKTRKEIITQKQPEKLAPTQSTTTTYLKTTNCDCSFAISASTNIELLITSPSGKQTGYLATSDRYTNEIPDASYGIGNGIASDTGEGPGIPDRNYFGVNNPEIGDYALEVIGKQTGKYQLDIAIALAPGEGKQTSLGSTTSPNQTDKYKFTIPDLSVQRIN